MFSRKNDNYLDRKRSSTLTIIGVGMDFSGEVSTEGDVHIDGMVKGSIKAHEVIIGMDGTFEGEISCNLLKVNGSLRGKFVVSLLHVCADGILEGRAKYDEITVESGGKIQGELGINKIPIKNNQSGSKLKQENGKDKNTENDES